MILSSGCLAAGTGRIIFYSISHTKPEIYICSIDSNGGNPAKLATVYSIATPLLQMLSADGKKLAFVDIENAESASWLVPTISWLCVIDTEGRNYHRVLNTSDLNVTAFSMAPDGKSIVFSRDVTRMTQTPEYGTVRVELTHDTDIYTVDAASGNVKQLTDTPDVRESDPLFSPNGKQVGFVGQNKKDDGNYGDRFFCVMDIDDSNRKEITLASGEFIGSFVDRWSPDGKQIAFRVLNSAISDNEGFSDIFVIDIERGSCTNLTRSPYRIDEEPMWSPDSQKIAWYSGNQDDGYYTWVMDADGGNKTRLNQTGGPAAWSPDGKHLIFAASLTENAVMQMETSGKNVRTLVKTGDLSVYSPVFPGK
jgi:Tol biopolymer transport system component